VQKAGHEDRKAGEVILESFAVRSIANQGKPGVGKGFKEGSETLKVLLRREAPYIQQKGALGVALSEARAHLGRTTGRMKEIGINPAWPEGDSLNSMFGQLLNHGDRGAQVHSCPVVAGAENLPNMWFEESQAIVMKILGKIGVVGDDYRQMQGAAVFPTTIVETGYSQEGGFDDVENVRLEIGDNPSHGGARKGKTEFRVKDERPAFHAHDTGMLEFGEAALRRKDEDFVAEAFELFDCLAERGDDSVDFGDECFSENDNSHVSCRRLVEGDCIRGYHVGHWLGWHLIEASGPEALAEHAAEWADVLELEIYPVIEDAAAGAAAQKVYGK
jgi:hypothetical protein